MSPAERKLVQMYSEGTLPEDNLDRCLQRINRICVALDDDSWDLVDGWPGKDAFFSALRTNLRAETEIYTVMTLEITGE